MLALLCILGFSTLKMSMFCLTSQKLPERCFFYLKKEGWPFLRHAGLDLRFLWCGLLSLLFMVRAYTFCSVACFKQNERPVGVSYSCAQLLFSSSHEHTNSRCALTNTFKVSALHIDVIYANGLHRRLSTLLG